MKQLRPILIGLMTSFGCFMADSAHAQRDAFAGPPINYYEAEVHDPVAKLAKRLEAREVELIYDEEHGYLKSILELLDIPVSSQTLVFSKTSKQINFISPHRPRAIYFNDNVYIGWCQNSDLLELAASDPEQGASFYSLDFSANSPPKIIRDDGQCLACHASSRTQDVPGYLVRSVYSDAGGRPVFSNGTYTTDDTSSFKERWGGWYVTGKHGDMRHMGNVFYNASDNELDRETGANLESLEKQVSTKPYLSNHSDIVALMVLGHQTQMHNAIAAANYETRSALHQSYTMNKILDRESDYVSESGQRRISRSADRVLKHLLMCGEFPLGSPVIGSSDFTKEFQEKGKVDSEGRSLRELDLKTRLFRYPCSFLIHSPAFDALPDEVRTLILSRLHAILDGSNESETYQHLSAEDRRNIRKILLETKPEFKATAK
jgi:hypothetical protein